MAALCLAVTAVASGEAPVAPLVGPETARVLAVRVAAAGSRQALQVLCSRPFSGVSTQREGPEVVVSLDAEAPESLQEPPAVPPLEAVRLVRRPGGVSLWVRVAAGVPFEVRRQETLLTVLFGEAATTETGSTGSSAASVADLYAKLFPAPAAEGGGHAETEAAPSGFGAETQGGLQLGALTLRPGIILSYVDADVAGFNGPAPVRDRYLQVQPTVAGEMPLLDGKLHVNYEPVLRSFSSYSEVGTTTHLANATLDLPVGSRLTLTAGEHFVHGLLETTEVDPGREYFFGLGRFTRWDTELGARIELGGRMGVDLGATTNDVSFDSPSNFFGYTAQTLHAGLGYELTPSLRAVLGYTFSRVPRPDARPLAGSTSHSVGLSLKGEITPLLTGQVGVAYLDQESPLAPPGGQRFRGLTTTVSLKKEFRPDTFVTLLLNRATDPSAFEQNAFYVTTAIQADATVPAPYSCAFRGSAGYQWNTYELPASAIGVPREDTLFAWSVGLGRPLGHRAFLRGDYRRERRSSNLPGFSVTTHSFIAQLGYGLFGPPVGH